MAWYVIHIAGDFDAVDGLPQAQGMSDTDCVVGPFDSEDEARKWRNNRLVEVGEIVPVNGKYRIMGDGSRFDHDSLDDAVHSWLLGQPYYSWFHIYEGLNPRIW